MQIAGSIARRRLWLWLDVLLVCLGFWLVAPVPVALIGGPYDAGLFVRLADSVLAGHWFGRFDALTLAKGPFYPLFLATCSALSVPMQAGIEAVYLAGALVMARVISHLSRRAWPGSLCLALLVFNPACTDWSTGALMREPLYCALTLLVMALAARLFLCRGGKWCGVATGVAFAAFWLTREEGVLIIPSLFILAAWYYAPFIGIALPRGRYRASGIAADFLPPLLPPLMAPLTALVLVFCVCAINQREYGVFRSNDFTHGPFPRAYGALARIVPDQWQRLTPISRDMRHRAYVASPAARELRPFLEGDTAHFTVDVPCPETGHAMCHDIPGASFIWALREAVASAGYYGTARSADGFYKRLTREIDAACGGGALRCLPPRRGFTPPLTMADVRPLLASLAYVSTDMLLLGDAGPLIMPSTAEGPAALAYAPLIRGSSISPPARFIGAPAWQITGALSSLDPNISLSVTAPPATSIASDWRITPDQAANVSLHRAAGMAEVFSATMRCAPGDCRLEVAGTGARLGSWPIASLATGVILDVPQAALYIDAVMQLPAFSRNGEGGLRWAVMRGASWAVASGSLLATPAAFVWLALCARRGFNPLLVLATSILLAVGLRVALLALLDATSIERQFRYESPATGLLLVILALAATTRPATPDPRRLRVFA